MRLRADEDGIARGVPGVARGRLPPRAFSPPAVSAFARQPDRLVSARDFRRYISALRGSFQRHRSNIAEAGTHKRRISAIPATTSSAVQPSSPHLQRRADPHTRAARAARTPESFPPPPVRLAPNGADPPGLAQRGAISSAQNIEFARKSANGAQISTPGCKLQPLCNRFATIKPLITNPIPLQLQSYSFSKSPICARVHAQARAHHARGPGAQPRNRAGITNDCKGIAVAARLQNGCTCNRHPGPAGKPELARQATGTPTGRGQAKAVRGALAPILRNHHGPGFDLTRLARRAAPSRCNRGILQAPDFSC